ncbi:hypothetical protein R5R35_012809 [Gryllus longicercus]|uniref:Uncharacterized protein n=1 Tax=Gryllus longicercus TaxID=2509291 RepID=A0AAN9V497_9ORTH
MSLPSWQHASGSAHMQRAWGPPVTARCCQQCTRRPWPHSANQRAHRPVADHSQDAILYVTVVIVFYAAIILLLVGTNLRRRSGRPRNAPPPPPQVLVYDQKRGTVQQKSVSPAAAKEGPAAAGATCV